MTDRRHDPDPRLVAAFGPESDAELEAQVPHELLGAAWPRLAAELAARPIPARRRRALPVALAAALALMIMVTGWLAAENRQLRRHNAEPTPLVEVVAPFAAGTRTATAGQLVRRLAQLPPDTPVLTAAEAEFLVRRDRPLLFAVLRGPGLDAVTRDGVTAAEALAVLRRLETGTPIRLGGVAAGRS